MRLCIFFSRHLKFRILFLVLLTLICFMQSRGQEMVLLDNQFKIIQIKDFTNPIFKNLQICYESEFAPITQTHMTCNGDYNQNDLASHWSKRYDMYLFYKDTIPAGFCVVNCQSMIDENNHKTHDIAEFYITPIFRKNGLGTLFARKVIMLYPGSWEIRELPELEKTSRKFWLKVIEGLQHNNFQEIVNHPNWNGFIQKFDI